MRPIFGSSISLTMAIVCRKRGSVIRADPRRGESARHDLGFGHLSSAEPVRKDTGDFDDARGKRGRGNRCDEEASWGRCRAYFYFSPFGESGDPAILCRLWETARSFRRGSEKTIPIVDPAWQLSSRSVGQRLHFHIKRVFPRIAECIADPMIPFIKNNF